MDQMQYIKDLERALIIAYRALTEGMTDLPAGSRDPRCSQLRAKAKREIIRVLKGRRGSFQDEQCL